MALDRAVQLAHAEGASPPTLRLYGWSRPTLTLGRFQALEGVDLQACASEGVDVVRRFTGGRAVLHDHEVTYAIVAGVADGVPRGTSASYRHLCGALVSAYAALGVPAELTARHRGSRDSAACYLHATSADVSLGARKLSGSAQVWHRQTVLQHGSFVITRDVPREGRLFGLDTADEEAFGTTTATIEDALGEAPTVSEVRDALIRGVATSLDVVLVAADYSAVEVERARGLLETVQVLGERDPGPAQAASG